MGTKEKKKEAALSLKQARKDLKAAWESVQHARVVLESLPPGPEHIQHQSDCGALWALSNQWSQCSTTIRHLIKGLETTK